MTYRPNSLNARLEMIAIFIYDALEEWQRQRHVRIDKQLSRLTSLRLHVLLPTLPNARHWHLPDGPTRVLKLSRQFESPVFKWPDGPLGSIPLIIANASVT